MLVDALDGIAIFAYVSAVICTIMFAAYLAHNVYFEGLSIADGAVKLVMHDLGALGWSYPLCWTPVLIPIWLIARGLHGCLYVGCWTWTRW